MIINHTGEDMNSEATQDLHYKSGGKTELLQIEKGRIRIELRKTLCVSSQIGCKLGCKFCATGTMKLEGNLTQGEIQEQLLIADYVLSIMNRKLSEKNLNEESSCSKTMHLSPSESNNTCTISSSTDTTTTRTTATTATTTSTSNTTNKTTITHINAY